MIERKVPKDIAKYESKVIGSLTLRQIVCYIPGLTIAGTVGICFYKTLGDLAIFLAVVLAMPFLLCGTWKPYGLPLEKFAKIMITTAILSPTKRKYKIENSYSKIFETNEKKVNQKSLKFKSQISENERI